MSRRTPPSTGRSSGHSRSFIGRFRFRVFALSLALLLAALAAVSYDAVGRFEHDLIPEMDRKARTVGESVAASVARAVDYGIPFRSLSGMEPFLNTARQGHPEILYLAVADTAGTIRFRSGDVPETVRTYFRANAPTADDADEPAGDHAGSAHVAAFYDTAVPIATGSGRVGTLHVGVDEKFVQSRLEDMLFDILIVLLVSLLITFELQMFLLTHSIAAPVQALDKLMERVANGDFRRKIELQASDEVGRLINGFNAAVDLVNDLYRGMLRRADGYRGASGERLRHAKNKMHAALFDLDNHFSFGHSGRADGYRETSLVDVRTPMFLFIFAEELSRSFFPIYVRELYAPVPGLSHDAVIGLPISLFMLFVAIATPWSGAWTDRAGSRRVFMIGAFLAVAGFVGTGLSYSLYDLLVWRSLTAVGYAMVTMACQGYILNITTTANRAQGMATFVGAIMVAAICGTSIGGVLADRIGFRATYIISAALALFAVFFVHHTFRTLARDPAKAPPEFRVSDMFRLLGNLRFAALMLLGAMPAKLILTGFLFFLTPLYLHELGNSQSAIGRGMMIYFIVMVFGTPLCARLADRLGRPMPLVALGGMVAGAGSLIVLWWENTLAVEIGVVALGIGHALGTAPLLSMIPKACPGEIKALGQTTVMGMFRVLERVGSVIGPFVAAGLIGVFGYGGTMAGLGAIVLASAVLFALFFLVVGVAPRARPPASPEAAA